MGCLIHIIGEEERGDFGCYRGVGGLERQVLQHGFRTGIFFVMDE